MLRSSFPVLAALLLSATPLLADTAPDPSGVWLRDDGNARVRIAPCGENVCATNLWIGDTSKGEAAGDRLVMTLKPSAADTLDGTAYDAKRDRTYSITVKVGRNSLSTRGCILGGILCRSVAWTAAQ